MIQITIEYEPETGRIACHRPSDPILALGLLERAKVMVAADLHGITPSPILKAGAGVVAAAPGN